MPERNDEESGYGWENYRRFVVAELKNLRDEAREAKDAALRVEASLGEQLGSLRSDVQILASSSRTETMTMKVQIAMLQVKSGVWGIAGGMGTVAIAILVAWASGKL